MQRIVKPKTQRGRRALERKEPKIFENSKSTLFFKGGNTSQTVTQVLKEMHTLKKPHATMFGKKNATRPFEDQSTVEFFTSKSDSSLFMYGCHSKKRPNNLVIGRLYDSQVLDMAEFGIDKFVSMKDVEGQKASMGIKPCLVFSGDLFEENDDNRRVKNLLLDFFRGPTVDNVSLSGLEHVMSIHGANGKVYIRNFRVLMKKSGSKTPRVELQSMGPSLDLSLRRTRLASDDLFKRALKKPATAKPKKKKNVSHDDLGNKLGRIHMNTQDFAKLQARKLKGLKRKGPVANGTDAGDESKKQKVDET
ncbi:ribosome production factor 2 homolog [Aplysia californica]|uniref:Ribosome production factor 2 homolog n=1 Tax=Aplysia californica TaxID=6500 RepID=A0ABM0JWD9_APLCA|nr:ribosome production factor 2 homolog [Aplysia californica]